MGGPGAIIRDYSVVMGNPVRTTLLYRSPTVQAILQCLLSALVFTVMFAGSVLGSVDQSALQTRASTVRYTLGSYIVELYSDENNAVKIGIGCLLLLLSLPLLLLGQRMLKISLVIISVVGCVFASLHIANLVSSPLGSGKLSYTEQVYNAIHNIAHKEDPSLYSSTIIAMCVGAVIGLLLGLATCSILKLGVALLGVITGYLVGGVFIGYFDPYMATGAKAGVYVGLICAFVILAYLLTPAMAIVFSALSGAFLFTFALQLFTVDPTFILSLIDGSLVTGRDPFILRGSSAPARYAVYIFMGVAVISMLCQTARYISRKKRGVGSGNASKGSL